MLNLLVSKKIMNGKSFFGEVMICEMFWLQKLSLEPVSFISKVLSLDRCTILPFGLMQIYEDEFIGVSMDTGTIEFGQIEQGGGKQH